MLEIPGGALLQGIAIEFSCASDATDEKPLKRNSQAVEVHVVDKLCSRTLSTMLGEFSGVSERKSAPSRAPHEKAIMQVFPPNPLGGYPHDAKMVIYEVTDADAYRDIESGHIAIFDTRRHSYRYVPGHAVSRNLSSWGAIVVGEFYHLWNNWEVRIGHPSDGLSCDTSEIRTLGWVTIAVDDALWVRPHFHLASPVAADAIGRGLLAGIIAYAVQGKDYTPWHICYNWDENDDYRHHIDCPIRIFPSNWPVDETRTLGAFDKTWLFHLRRTAEGLIEESPGR